MRSTSIFCSVVLLGSAMPTLASTHIHRGPTAPRNAKSHAARASYHPAKTANASANTSASMTRTTMDPVRASEIQAALIRTGYMTGEPTGSWDATTRAAMARLQAENGWPTKVVPDARAIIKLGLGPNQAAPAPIASPQRAEAAQPSSSSD